MSDATQAPEYTIPAPRPRNERKPTDAVRALVRRIAATIGTTPDEFGQARRSLPETSLDDFVHAVVDSVGPARERKGVVVPTRGELIGLFDSPDVSDLVCLRFIAELRGDPHKFYLGEPYGWMYEHRALDLEGIAVLAQAYPQGERSIAERLVGYGRSIVEQWADEDVWPFFARRPSLLDLVVATVTDGLGEDERRAAIRILGRFPTPPHQALRLLYDLALGERKTFRRDARSVLARDPLRASRVREALVSRDATVRANAAAWSVEIADDATIDAVERAIAAETNDAAFSAMIETLEARGRSVESYVGLERLADDADRGLAKGIPKDLAWFPFAELPAIRIATTAAPVSRTSIEWLIVSANRAKVATPSELLRRRVAQFDARDRHALGAFVFSAWMEHDVRPATPVVASARADRAARSLVEAARDRFYGVELFEDSPLEGMTESEISSYLFGTILGNPIESAVANKGLLAIAAACANGAIVAPATAYIRRWYGMRPVQGKMLLEMLAWIDDPRAVAALLSIATRFRTRSFQDVALEQIRGVAQRKRWTVDELADRTISAAGFNDDVCLELSYGTRAFEARIASDGGLSLADESGHLIENLPAPRNGDDEAAAKEARSLLAQARKELKAIVSDQTVRLYEAMCSGRTWLASDLRRYLVLHPVVGRLVTRLVFSTVGDPKNVISFRPTLDGEIVGPSGERVAVDERAEIAVAHDLRVSRDDAERWRAHLARLTIEPLFQQFGTEPFERSSVRLNDESFTGVAGFVIPGRTLLEQIRKRGWARGPAHDANRYYSYDKRFPSIGILAVLNFSGNAVPEDARVVALEALTFERLASGPNFGAPKLPFSDVPPVLIAEAVADVRAFARAGTGFDPNFRPIG